MAQLEWLHWTSKLSQLSRQHLVPSRHTFSLRHYEQPLSQGFPYLRHQLAAKTNTPRPCFKSDYWEKRDEPPSHLQLNPPSIQRLQPNTSLKIHH